MGPATITSARREHLPEVAAIYAAATLTPATFDLEGWSSERWREVLDAVDAEAGDQLLVALDESGAVLGYTRSGPFKDRPAYATTRETSLYVDERARGQGVGGALYAELLRRLDGVGLRLAVAGVAQPNPASDRLHRAHGFVEVGTFRNVGVKLGRAWDVRWYQRPLRP